MILNTLPMVTVWFAVEIKLVILVSTKLPSPRGVNFKSSFNPFIRSLL